MKRNPLLSIIIAMLATSAVFADNMSGTHVLYTPAVDVTAMSQNSYVGTVGGVFLTSGSTWPYVNWLGYADPLNQGLRSSHQIDLWYMGGNGGPAVANVAQAIVPAGTAAPWYDGYRWVQLRSTVNLWYGSWYTISAQTDGTDLWGDLLSNSSSTQINWDNGGPAFANSYVGNNGGWSRAGRYGSTAPPGTQVGTSDSIFPVANLGYLLLVPEPTALSLLALGAAALAYRRRNSDR